MEERESLDLTDKLGNNLAQVKGVLNLFLVAVEAKSDALFDGEMYNVLIDVLHKVDE